MRIAYLQVPLSLPELNQLIKEFPQFIFLSFPKQSTPISKEHWRKIEILFGRRLICEDLQLADQLRWVHCPIFEVNTLCIKEIEQRGNILVTNTVENNSFQIAEYVLAAVLAFAKNLFTFQEINRYPHLVWDCKWRNKMWSLQDKTFLQIGMEPASIEIARRMKETGMRIWGMNERGTFFPHCHRTFSFADLEEVLPCADVVSVLFPPTKKYEHWLSYKELRMMKEDSILTLLGSAKLIDHAALKALAEIKKWRGILLDADYQFPLATTSPLWQIPNLIITPEVAPRPKRGNQEAFKIFRYNLRQYLRGHFSEMKNVVDPSILFDIQDNLEGR
ncbi:MAG: NAD(P)-dependent oxidoreductase [Parachlamydiaceae bacterium]